MSTNSNQAGKSLTKNRKSGTTIVYIILILISIIWITPFILLILQSFRSFITEDGGMVDYVLPKEFSLDSYTWLFSKDSQFLLWYRNTFIIALCCSLLNTMVVLCVAYALSRLRFSGRTFLMRVWLILGMFPGFLTMICLYFLLKMLGLTQEGAIPGLILVSVAGSGMGYYITKGFFDTIPRSLDEAARIDGASRARIFVQIIMPLSKPIVIYMLLTAFMAPWADYIFASYIAFGYSDRYTVAVALTRWVWNADYSGYFTRYCAGGSVKG